MSQQIARILLHSPLPQLDRLFDYQIPVELADKVRAGIRVKVPFGYRKKAMDGFVVELVESSTFLGDLSPISKVVSTVPVLTPDLWRLARAVADRQAGCASDVLRLAIPSRYARAEKTWFEHHGGLLAPGLGASSAPSDPAPQRLSLQPQPGGRDVHDTWLPHWVLELAERAKTQLQLDRSTIICVPDFRDIELVMKALSDLPTPLVTRVDSAAQGAKRYTSYLDILGGRSRIVVGNRSALYAPVRDLGLIAVWDDADHMFEEPLAPYAHARDVALLRQQLSQASLLFAGHSRSVATQRLIEVGWLTSETTASKPRVVPSDELLSVDPALAHVRIPPIAWRTAADAVATGPVLFQVASPGFAGALVCRDCDTVARCSACHGPLHQPTATSHIVCRWCAKNHVALSCASCNGTRISQVSPGAERTVQDLGKGFPGVPVKAATGEHRMLAVEHTPSIIVATAGAEPVAEGGYAAVILLDCSRMLHNSSLSGTEDALRAWFNAAALAARDAQVVAVGLGGRLARALTGWNPQIFTHQELSERAELGFPPMVRVCSITGPISTTRDMVENCGLSAGVELVGPALLDETTEVLLLRMRYQDAAETARALKTAVVRNATTSAKSGQSDIRVLFDRLLYS